MGEQSAVSRRDMEARLIARAWQDEGFKQSLMSDPKAAIRQEFGIAIPPHVQVQVLEETPERLYLTLPRNRTELSDEELDAVAGGLSEFCCW
jgi:hypothetical protein